MSLKSKRKVSDQSNMTWDGNLFMSNDLYDYMIALDMIALHRFSMRQIYSIRKTECSPIILLAHCRYSLKELSSPVCCRHREFFGSRGCSELPHQAQELLAAPPNQLFLPRSYLKRLLHTPRLLLLLYTTCTYTNRNHGTPILRRREFQDVCTAIASSAPHSVSTFH